MKRRTQFKEQRRIYKNISEYLNISKHVKDLLLFYNTMKLDGRFKTIS